MTLSDKELHEIIESSNNVEGRLMLPYSFAREVEEAVLENCAALELLHALKTLLGDTEDSDYMSAAEQKALARKAVNKVIGILE